MIQSHKPKIQTIFQEYYNEKKETSKRRLQWIWSLGNATVRGSWGGKKNFDLQVTTLQAVAIMCFNDIGEGAASATEEFEKVRERLNLPEETMKRVLHSLSCGKYKVLEKQPKSNTVKATDTFRAAPKFSCEKKKVRIPMANLEDSGSTKRVEEDRSVAIEVDLGDASFYDEL